jgi:hypothetical protein
VIAVSVPVKIESSLNLREHWRKRALRTAGERQWARLTLKEYGCSAPTLPIVVTLTRVAPRMLDGDNLQGGFKAVRDGVADWLGLDDNDKRIEWRYAQRRGAAKEYAAEIEIDEVACAA